MDTMTLMGYINMPTCSISFSGIILILLAAHKMHIWDLTTYVLLFATLWSRVTKKHNGSDYLSSLSLSAMYLMLTPISFTST